jgi:hypothetical protein
MTAANGSEVRSEGEASVTAMELIYEDAMAIPSAELQPINADVETMVAGTLDHVPDLRALRPQLEHHRFPLDPVDKVEDYALALLEAHLANRVTEGVDPAETAVLGEASELVEKCQTEEVVLTARKVMHAKEFEGITRRTGYRNRGLALACYALVFVQAWDRIEGHTELKRSDLDHFKLLSRKLIAISATRDPRLKTRGEVLATEDMRRRAFHLLDKALIELRFQVNFLFRYEPEKVERYLPQVKRKPQSAPEPGRRALRPERSGETGGGARRRRMTFSTRSPSAMKAGCPSPRCASRFSLCASHPRRRLNDQVRNAMQQTVVLGSAPRCDDDRSRDC